MTPLRFWNNDSIAAAVVDVDVHMTISPGDILERSRDPSQISGQSPPEKSYVVFFTDAKRIFSD